MPSAESKAKSKEKDDDEQPPPLLARLPEAKQWLLYGLLMYPDDLAEPGAIDLLVKFLNTTCVLARVCMKYWHRACVYGTPCLHGHGELSHALF